MRAPLLTVLAGLVIATPAIAAAPDLDAPQATLTWRLGFGGDAAVTTGYGLAFGYRGEQPLLELNVSDRAAAASVAGLPLFARSYRLQQASGSAPDAGQQPWYARTWVWWTAGGLALTAAALGSGGSSSEEHNNQVDGNVGPVLIDGENGSYEACVPNSAAPDTCTQVEQPGGP